MDRPDGIHYYMNMKYACVHTYHRRVIQCTQSKTNEYICIYIESIIDIKYQKLINMSPCIQPPSERSLCARGGPSLSNGTYHLQPRVSDPESPVPYCLYRYTGNDHGDGHDSPAAGWKIDEKNIRARDKKNWLLYNGVHACTICIY